MNVALEGACWRRRFWWLILNSWGHYSLLQWDNCWHLTLYTWTVKWTKQMKNARMIKREVVLNIHTCFHLCLVWFITALDIFVNFYVGHIDHSARVMRVITWNRSFKGIPDPDGNRDDFDNDEGETHATVLDKILAWEKKLYDEVKVNIMLNSWILLNT